ncbi:hypothetical protein Y695_03745 [Hydrogenophaga sp. T4]|nr:hypothetical protein Y695_03745 [Hydrogenophaga sp. T4]
MVALVLFELAGVVAVFLANGHGLRRAGLAAALVTGAGKHARRSAFGGHALHGPQNHIDVLPLVAQVDRCASPQGGALPCHHILRGEREVGRVLDAAIGQCGHGVGELQHGEVVVTLADAQRDGLARVPALLLGPLVAAALPVRAGQHAAHLALEVEAGDLAKAQRFHEIVHGVHAHFIGQRVVVGVARLDDAAVHVDRAQATIAVAAEAVVAEHPVARVVDHGGGAAGAISSAPSAMNGL